MRAAPQHQPGVTDLTDFPLRLSGRDMQRIFGYSASGFYALLAAGAFDRFEILPPIGARAWSRTLVQRYLDGDLRPAAGSGWGARSSTRST